MLDLTSIDLSKHAKHAVCTTRFVLMDWAVSLLLFYSFVPLHGNLLEKVPQLRTYVA